MLHSNDKIAVLPQFFFCLKNHRARWNNNHILEATSVYLYLCLMCLNKIREIHKQRKISEKQFRMIYPDFSI